MVSVLMLATMLAIFSSVPADAQDPETFLPDSILYPGNKPGYIFVVFKATQEMRIYRHDGEGDVWLEKVLPCSTGMLQGDKLIRGDKKTPEGYYIFRQKLLPSELPDIYGILAYPMDYPNFWDKNIGRGGDGIWTHGINKPLVDYDSNGCIELFNHDIAALEPYIKLYETPILVYDSPNFLSVDELKQQAEQITDFVQSWLTAWANKDLEQYAKKYDKNFYNSENRSYQGWMDHKRRLAQSYKQIKVTLTDLKIFRHRDVIVVSFTQNYNGDNRFKSIGSKRLYLSKTDSGYLISGEEYNNLPGLQPEKWLTAEQREQAFTTPPLAVAQISEPLASASAGALLPSKPAELAQNQVSPTSGVDEDAQAAADETARASLESLSIGRNQQNPPQPEQNLAGQDSALARPSSDDSSASSDDSLEANVASLNSSDASLEAADPSLETSDVSLNTSDPSLNSGDAASPADSGQEKNQPQSSQPTQTTEPDQGTEATMLENPVALASFDDPLPSVDSDSNSNSNAPTEKDALDLLSGWISAWSQKDQEKYFSYYSPNFYFAGLKLHLNSFKRYRGNLMSKTSSIKVEALSPQVAITGSKAKVTFEQIYQSDQTSDRGIKTLELTAVDGLWKIDSETFKALP
jgi:murein L,D-transpeptidase YafK